MGNDEFQKLVIEQLGKINTRLDGMDARLDKMDARLDKMDARLDKMDNRLDKMDNRFDSIESCLDSLEGQTQENTACIKALLHRTEELDAKFDGLLNTAASKDALARLEAKIEKLATKDDLNAIGDDVSFLVRKAAEHDVAIRRLRLAE